MGDVQKGETGMVEEVSDAIYIPSPSDRQRADLGAGQRTLVVVAALGTLSDSLVSALKREFPWLVVEQVEGVEAAWRAFDHPVSLILIDALSFTRMSESLMQLPQWHPNSLTVLMEHGDRRIGSPRQLFESGRIQGVLPMDLRLDIWLSVMRVMLRGGEYFPSSFLQATMSQPAPVPSLQRNLQPPSLANQRSTSASRFFELTRREIQVLELIARGAQNKAIAAAFALSEHTVKIHVHNIIAKMGISNRTEAAARFRDYRPLPNGADIG
jgi:DNA-binding NarL/FixJ family response regulator